MQIEGEPENIGEQIAETIGDEIADVLENASEEIDAAQQTAEAIARAAMETETGRRMSALETRMDEWQANQNDTSQAIAALVMGVENLTGQVSVLLTQQPPTNPNPPSEPADGPGENPVENLLEPEVPEAPEPEVPEIPVKKKRGRWI